MTDCIGVVECGRKHQAHGLCSACCSRIWRKNNPERYKEYLRQWHKNNPRDLREYTKNRYESRKPGGSTIYGLHLSNSIDIFYVGRTIQHLDDRLKKHRLKMKIPNIQIRPIVSNIQNELEAKQLENDYIIRYDTIENGMNKKLNLIRKNY